MPDTMYVDRDSLQGTVRFFMHPTFPNVHPVVTVGPSGVAELILGAWGAFTVGAVTDVGQTKLELRPRRAGRSSLQVQSTLAVGEIYRALPAERSTEITQWPGLTPFLLTTSNS